MKGRKLIGWDVESFLIAPGVAYPQLVCVTWDDGENTGILLDQDGVEWFREQLKNTNVVLTSHNANYDILVNLAEDETLITLIRLALEDGRLRCTKVREKVIQNATGELYYEWDEESESLKGATFNLQRLVWKHFQIFLKKEEDTWRMRYRELFRIPLAQWPPEAREYAINDATWHRRLFLKQDEICEGEEIPGELHVTRTSVALGCLRSWGVRTDAESVEELAEQITLEYEFWVTKAQGFGLIRASKTPGGKRSRDMKLIKERVVSIYTKFNLKVPEPKRKGKKAKKVSSGGISTDRETMTFSGGEAKKIPRTEFIEGPDGKKIACVDVALKCVSEVIRTQALLSNYIKTLRTGVNFPITPDYNEMVETCRTSCSKPNLQNQGRGGGVRKCFVPRPGSIFAFSDYDSLEMRTFAQTCIDMPEIGYSFISEAVKEGRDLHVDMATETLGGMDYAEAMRRYESGDKILDDVRQGSKIANYGMLGGMGPDAFVDYARGYGVEITLARARELHHALRRKWRETVPYFNYCSNLCDGSEAERAVHPRTKMVRGKVRYTALCNFFFQHLAAIGATGALWRVVMETLDPTLNSPLYGCRAWYFGHDEIGMEIPYAVLGPKKSHEAAMRLQTVMISTMKEWVPDVPIGATVALCRRWLKGCKPIRVGGLLVPARQEGKKWVPDLDGLEGAEELRVAA